MTHGTRARYSAGCRCTPCRAANSRYKAGRDAARKDGDQNGVVSADSARKHLLTLKRYRVGLALISEASGVPLSSLAEIRSGRRRFIRARTERALLLVDRHARSEGTLVPADTTWKLLVELIDEGFTEPELAARLGYKRPVLPFRRAHVTARTERKVERFHQMIMEGA